MSERQKLSPQGEVLEQLIRTIVGGIVDDPAAIHIVVVESGSTVVIELTVARSDIGKVIGRQGSMARALRTVLSNAATKHSRRSVLQIIE